MRNCIESAVVLCSDDEISLQDLPPNVSKSATDDYISMPLGITIDEAEKLIIQATLSKYQNNKSKTADVLGIGRKTLLRKLEEYGLEQNL